MTELVVAEHSNHGMVQRSFFQMPPRELVTYAAEIATVLSDVIERQGLDTDIKGKRYIKVEGWQTLGSLLGISAREKSVTRLSDGSYEAYVELVKIADGVVIGGASALCSIAEIRWGRADEYARRSMAVTRATSKSFRLTFAWVAALAGYETTPAEEMPIHVEAESSESSSNQEEKPVEIYVGSTEQQEKIKAFLESKNIKDDFWGEIHLLLVDHPMKHLSNVLTQLKGEHGDALFKSV